MVVLQYNIQDVLIVSGGQDCIDRASDKRMYSNLSIPYKQATQHFALFGQMVLSLIAKCITCHSTVLGPMSTSCHSVVAVGPQQSAGPPRRQRHMIRNLHPHFVMNALESSSIF